MTKEERIPQRRPQIAVVLSGGGLKPPAALPLSMMSR